MSENLFERLTAPGPKRILALDGGGVRGSLILGFLEAIERLLRERYGRPDMRLCEYFDLIGGTSVGAILAGGLATGMDVGSLVETSLTATDRIFGRRRWKAWQAIFNPEPLHTVLHDTFGDIRLGDERVETGLCIVAKRADTRSTWPLINHPSGRFYPQNRDILLRDAIYASAAAPYYFVPTRFDVGQGEDGAFVDGGVSMANNPALQLFLLATLQGFPFHWDKGEDRLLVVSIGTGWWHQREPVDKVVNAKAWDWTREIPMMLMQDANSQAQLLLQYLSRSPTPWSIDAEVGDLGGDLLTPEPALSYIRYNVRFNPDELNELGIALSDAQIASLRSLAARQNRDTLLRIGRAAAERQVRPSHFPVPFDELPG